MNRRGNRVISKRDYLSYVKDDSGVALITALVILVLLTALGTYAINMTEIEGMLAGNLKASKQAFYLADAGIEWGRQQIAVSPLLPPVPADATQSLNAGGYTVRFRNPFPAVPALEYTVRVEADGNIGTASKTLHAVVTKTFNLSDGAIAIRGKEADSAFTGNAFLVDGRDYNHLDDTLTSLPPQLGISVQSATHESDVEGALTSSQRDRIKGLDGTASDPSVGVSSSSSSSTITTLANELCDDPSAIRLNTPNNGTLTLNGNNTWGTRASPKIYCVDGVGDPGYAGVDVDINGNFSGAGVLVVRNAELIAKGNFKFEGLVIVTGAKVGFGMVGGGQQDVYGAVMINETWGDSEDFQQLVLKGNASVKRSQSALAMAGQSIPAAALASIIPGLPSSTQRVSWVEVNP
jgi:Tfp pilus assembly protein PilX